MNAIAIEYQNTADLIPYARNSRTHSDEQVAQIAASIREFGFTNPVLIDAENGIIAGHGRILGAGKLGIEQVPCIRLGYLTDAQKRAYVIADNKLALNAGWDEEMLRLEVADLQDVQFDLDLLGFSHKELEELIDSFGDDGGPAPAPKPFDYQEKFSIIVECENESHQAQVFETLKNQGYSLKVLVN